MLKRLKIRIDKRHAVYGQLNGSLKMPLIIFVHGLCSSMSESLIHEGATWFAKHRYSTFRFDLYGWQESARQIVDCTLKMHTSDMDAVIHYFRKRGVKKVFVIGHSYGGPTALLSKDQDFDAAVLWDPSYNLKLRSAKYGGRYVKQLNGYLMDTWGINVVLGRKMVEESEALNWDDMTKGFHVPLKIISAGKGEIVAGAKKYFYHAHGPKELTIVKGATHYFDDNEGMREEIFRISKKWFESYR